MSVRSVSLSRLAHHFLEQKGGVMCICRVGNGGSWWHGAARSRRQMCHDGLAPGEDAVWRRGGVDGRSGKDLHFGLHPGDGSA
jgi:hypothetical protein